MRSTSSACLTVLALSAAAIAQSAPATAPSIPPAKGKIVLARDTTFLTDGPLDDDGVPDYVKAYDALLSKGVTAENNAYIPLLKILGPAMLAKKSRTAALNALGLSPDDLPATGDYFQSLPDFLTAQGMDEDEKNALLDQALPPRIPWDGEQFPQLAMWAGTNGKQLDAAVSAVTRDRWYIPAAGGNMMMDLQLPALGQFRQLADCLALRSQIRAGKGQLDAAWQDALAVHRLARLVSQGGTMIEHMVGYAIENVAIHADTAIFSSGKLTAAQAKACLADLQKLAPLGPLADVMNLSERLTKLDNVIYVAQDLPRIKKETLIQEYPQVHILPEEVAKIDWSLILRHVNADHDMIVAAMTQATFARRDAALQKCEDHRDEIMQLPDGDPDPAKRMDVVMHKLLAPGNFRHTNTIYERAFMLADLDQVAFALAAYRAEKGGYPDTLAALAPAYLKTIPADRFTDKPLIYKPAADGYLLYSVNDDLEDNGGTEKRDANGHCDLVVRVGK